MGGKNNKPNSQTIYKNKPHILVFWFDQNNKNEENKKHKVYIQRNVFPPILRKYPGLEIVLHGFTKLSSFPKEMLTNKNLITLLVITSGTLKKEAISTFENFEKLEGILVFCSNASFHNDATRISKKNVILSVVDKKDEFYYEISKIVHKIDKNIETKIELFNKIYSKSFINLNSNSNNFDLDNKFSEPQTFKSKNVLEIVNTPNGECENIYKFNEEICDDEGFNFSIYSQLKRKNEIDPNLINALGEYIKTLKIDFDPEEEFERFKSEVLSEFNDIDNFSCNSEYLEKVYLTPIKQTNSIKELAKKLLFLYTTHYKNILFYDVINRNLRNFNKARLKKLKHIICGLLLNFNQKYSTLKNYKFVHRFTNLERGFSNLNEGDVIFCNQFLSCTLNNDLKDCKFYKERNTIFIIELNYYENLNFFFNYISLEDETRYLAEEEILFCPFTKFEVQSKSFLDNGKLQIHLKQLLNNSLIKLIYDFTFKIGKSFAYNEEDKKDIYASNAIYFENYLKTLLQFKGSGKDYLIQLAGIYQSLGALYYKTSDFYKSLANFESALALRKQINNGLDLSVSETYNSIGDVLVKQSKYKQAIENYTNSLINVIQLEGKENIYVAICYNNLGTVNKHLSDFQKALYYYEEAIKILNKTGKSNLNQSLTLFKATLFNNIANIYKIQNKFYKSLTFYQNSEKIILENLGENSLEAATIYSNIGFILKELSQFKLALEKLTLAETIVKTQLGTKNSSLSVIYDYLGSVYNTMGDSEKAYCYYSQALNIAIEVAGEISDLVAQGYNNVGNVLLAKREFKAAEDYFHKAAEIYKENNDMISGGNVNLVFVLNNLGSTYLAQQKVDEAMKIFFESLTIIKKQLKDDNAAAANVYSLIGSCYMKIKKYNQALENYEKALKIREKVFERKNLLVANSHNEVGDALLKTLKYYTFENEDEDSYVIIRRFSEISELYDCVDNLKKNELNKETSTTGDLNSVKASRISKKSSVSSNKSRKNPKPLTEEEIKKNILENAIFHYQSAFDLFKEIFENVDNLHTAQSYLNLANAFKMKGEKELSLSYHNRCLKIRLEMLKGHDNLEVGTCLISLAGCYSYFKLFSEAVDKYSQGIEILTKFQNKEQFCEVIAKYVICLEKIKKYEVAKKTIEEYLDVFEEKFEKKYFNYFVKKLIEIYVELGMEDKAEQVRIKIIV